MKITIACIALLLTACGGGMGGTGLPGSVVNQSFDQQAASGLRVRWDFGDHQPSVDVMDQWFQFAITCADMTGPPERDGKPVRAPLLVIVPPGTNDPFDGKTYYSSSTILIESEWENERSLYVHEFIRWILYVRGVSPDDQAAATQPEFQCQS